ncbi:2TM domain-containing protein [Galbibacter sp. EGI 63066]|uniref:2TM domain-containing protein n=1 Tax=Galbibacter sp. EGI 63066 TaxID=2993559 RepID=UPI0022497CBE|nr:2TM domain-containing protein [Galbibacter sp. EGI 63066]MCX2680235.1 2TM domain-containing protein [Galbibacter sp. EGI 63066]
MSYTEEQDKYKKARKRVQELKEFYWHLAIFIIINSHIFVNVYIDTARKGESFWHYTTFITFFSWGVGLAVHAWCALWKHRLFSKKWEQKMIDRFMQKEARQH